jgi:hypothetical protein
MSGHLPGTSHNYSAAHLLRCITSLKIAKNFKPFYSIILYLNAKGLFMVKIQVRVKPPQISFLKPFRLNEELTAASKEERFNKINEILIDIERWANAERNYNS